MKLQRGKKKILAGLSVELSTRVLSFLQNFYKTELNKEEMYIRYIHKLYDLHLKAQNFTGNRVSGAGRGRAGLRGVRQDTPLRPRVRAGDASMSALN